MEFIGTLQCEMKELIFVFNVVILCDSSEKTRFSASFRGVTRIQMRDGQDWIIREAHTYRGSLALSATDSHTKKKFR